MFLRHLRRTRLLLQVVDASAADPGTDYLAVREELRMYNPDYVTRPHVVALNKVDLEDAGVWRGRGGRKGVCWGCLEGREPCSSTCKASVWVAGR